MIVLYKVSEIACSVTIVQMLLHEWTSLISRSRKGDYNGLEAGARIPGSNSPLVFHLPSRCFITYSVWEDSGTYVLTGF